MAMPEGFLIVSFSRIVSIPHAGNVIKGISKNLKFSSSPESFIINIQNYGGLAMGFVLFEKAACLDKLTVFVY